MYADCLSLAGDSRIWGHMCPCDLCQVFESVPWLVFVIGWGKCDMSHTELSASLSWAAHWESWVLWCSAGWLRAGGRHPPGDVWQVCGFWDMCGSAVAQQVLWFPAHWEQHLSHLQSPHFLPVPSWEDQCCHCYCSFLPRALPWPIMAQPWKGWGNACLLHSDFAFPLVNFPPQSIGDRTLKFRTRCPKGKCGF